MPTKNRPDYVHCIGRSHVQHLDKTWCGKRADGFHFVDIDHAAENGLQHGRLVACSECVAAIFKALQNGHDQS